jgi:putative membrane protein insertion efficiency factor
MPKRPTSSRAASISRPHADGRTGLPAQVCIALLRVYRLFISPILPASCRFTPSCSAFAIEAIERHGGRRGVRLAVLRVARCHPWHPGGYDPVPDSEM